MTRLGVHIYVYICTFEGREENNDPKMRVVQEPSDIRQFPLSPSIITITIVVIIIAIIIIIVISINNHITPLPPLGKECHLITLLYNQSVNPYTHNIVPIGTSSTRP